MWEWLNENAMAISAIASMMAVLVAAGGWFCTFHSHRFLTGPKLDKIQRTMDDKL